MPRPAFSLLGVGDGGARTAFGARCCDETLWWGGRLKKTAKCVSGPSAPVRNANLGESFIDNLEEMHECEAAWPAQCDVVVCDVGDGFWWICGSDVCAGARFATAGEG